MKKIMFSDKYGLTDAVLKGSKTMTRRTLCLPEYWHGMWVWSFAFDKQSHSIRLFDADEVPMEDPDTGECAYVNPHYKIGDVVAVAQSYKSCGYTKEWVVQHVRPNPNANWNDPFEKKYPGWNNKMFVRADLMPHKIRITDVKVEMLQDISDEDCFKEGIIPITWRQHLPQDLDDVSPQKYIDHNVYTLEKFREGIEDCWAESDPNEYMAEDAKTAFAVLIFKMYGRKVWEGNPYVFAYTFELVK